MWSERVRVGPKLGDNKRHALHHEGGGKGNVAREPVELGDDDRALRRSCGSKRQGQLRTALEGVRTLPCFRFHVFLNDGQALGLGKPLHCASLRVE